MARVTVEDCIEKVRDRFELVAIAAQRTKNIASGSGITISKNGEKNTVISLREIAGGSVNVEELREDLVKNFQRQRDMDEDLKQDDVFGSVPLPTSGKIQRLASEDDADEGDDDFEDEGIDPAAEEELLKSIEDGGEYSFEDEAATDED